MKESLQRATRLNHQAVPDSGRCSTCSGSGWVLDPDDLACPCPVCGGTITQKTGVPDVFQNRTLKDFDFKVYGKDLRKLEMVIQNFESDFVNKWKYEGKGLYLWSKTPGSGKTLLSCCLLSDVVSRYHLQGRFVSCVGYLSILQQAFTQQGNEDRSQVYRSCDFLVLDDLGVQKDSEWTRQEIFRLLNDRLNDGLITLITSNYPPEELNVGSRSIDRIMKSCIVLQLPEVSIRSKQAKAEQEKFLAGILSDY